MNTLIQYRVLQMPSVQQLTEVFNQLRFENNNTKQMLQMISTPINADCMDSLTARKSPRSRLSVLWSFRRWNLRRNSCLRSQVPQHPVGWKPAKRPTSMHLQAVRHPNVKSAPCHLPRAVGLFKVPCWLVPIVSARDGQLRPLHLAKKQIPPFPTHPVRVQILMR